MSLQNAKRPATARSVNGPHEASLLGSKNDSAFPTKSALNQAQSRARLKFLACRLHELGEKPLFHFLDEVERGEALRPHLERYASLPASFIKANGGDRFAPPLHVIDGGGP